MGSVIYLVNPLIVRLCICVLKARGSCYLIRNLVVM